MTTPDTHAAALDALSLDVYDPSDLSDTDIVTLMTALKITDAEVGAEIAAADQGMPLDGLTAETLSNHRRWFLGSLPGWLPVKHRMPSYSWLPDGALDEEVTDEYPGLPARMVPWWNASLGWAAFSGGRRRHGDAPEWYRTAPESGWLAYAAGLSLSEYRNPATRPDPDALWTLVALRAPQSQARSASMIDRAARRVLDARTAFVHLGGNPDALTVLS